MIDRVKFEMEFPYFVQQLLKADENGFSIIDGTAPQKYRRSGAFNIGMSRGGFGGQQSAMSQDE